tara:strand:+ start:245 stop:364 length:120 start_codon:yes stop_codon:yes gene_type:complete
MARALKNTDALLRSGVLARAQCVRRRRLQLNQNGALISL